MVKVLRLKNIMSLKIFKKETMNAIADPKGVPMKVMLEGLEKR